MNNHFGVGIANPSSAYCEEQGGKSEIRTDSVGNQWGACKFTDGTECEEWDFYGKKCSPGQCKKVVLDKTTNKSVCSDPIIPVPSAQTSDKSIYVIGGVVGTFLAILGIGLVSTK